MYSLEYNIPDKRLAFLRKDNQWNDLYDPSLIVPEKVGFFYSMLLLIYHILRGVFVVIFWLAGVSLLVNFLVHWRRVLGWFRELLLRRRAAKLPQQDIEDDEHYRVRPGRNVARLSLSLDDSENL